LATPLYLLLRVPCTRFLEQTLQLAMQH